MLGRASSKLFKSILDLKPARPLRAALVRREIAHELNRVNSCSLDSGFPVLSRTNSDTVTWIKNRKKVFILGSGASVLEISAAQFREVEQSPSIGFGAWPLHYFVPTLIALGPTRGLEDYTRVFTTVMERPDIVAKKPEVLLLRSSLPADLGMFGDLPGQHWERTRIYGRVSPISRTIPGLRQELNYWLKPQSNPSEFSLQFDSGSTLLRMMSLAIKSGAEEIVLLGVDMNSPEYFWETDPSFLVNNGFSSFHTGQTEGSHDTTFAGRRPFSVIDAVREMHSVFKTVRGGKIFVASPQSALAELLPLFTWKS